MIKTCALSEAYDLIDLNTFLDDVRNAVFASYLIRFKTIIDPHFLYYFLQSDFYWNSIHEKKIGIALANVSATKIKSIQIQVPPINEQKRIVSKIESIFAKIDKTETLLKAIRARNKQLRQVVLKRAFEGELVPQDPDDTPVEYLKGETERGNPAGWIETTLNTIADSVKKINPWETPNKLYSYCDINSINNSCLQIVGPKQFLGRNAPSRARQLIKTNDVLFSTVRTYLKNIAIVPNGLDNQLASTGFCIIRSKINHKFVFYYVQTKSFLDPLNKIQRGTNYPAIRTNDVMNSVILVPPLNEQKRIVSKIESVFTRIDAIDEHITKLLSVLAMLRKSVLKHAFEGRLVPQDPNDEPAYKLLERVRGA